MKNLYHKNVNAYTMNAHKIVVYFNFSEGHFETKFDLTKQIIVVFAMLSS